MRTVTVAVNQTIFDIALQTYGDIDGVFNLCRDNDIQFFEPVKAGQTLVVNKKNIINKNIVKYYQRHGIYPASGVHFKAFSWILRHGKWDDEGVWRDNAFWQDN